MRSKDGADFIGAPKIDGLHDKMSLLATVHVAEQATNVNSKNHRAVHEKPSAIVIAIAIVVMERYI